MIQNEQEWTKYWQRRRRLERRRYKECEQSTESKTSQREDLQTRIVAFLSAGNAIEKFELEETNSDTVPAFPTSGMDILIDGA